MEQIVSHNSDPNATYKMGVNQFTDRTKDELKSTTGYNRALG